MNIGESEVPLLRAIAGPELFAHLKEAVKSWHLRRVEADLRTIRPFLSDAQLLRHYLRPLRKDTIGTVAELFAVARGASRARNLTPHAHGRGSKRIDALLTYEGESFALEVKHQRDAFPFDGRRTGTISNTSIHEGLRPGADLRFSDLAPLKGATKQVPGSDIWRSTLIEAAAQLSPDRPGIIAVSVDAFGSDVIDDIGAALYGDSEIVATPTASGRSGLETARVENGVFAQGEFAHVQQVWFFKLQPTAMLFGSEHETLCEWAHGAHNPNAPTREIPGPLTFAFPEVIGPRDVASYIAPLLAHTLDPDG